MFRQFFNDIRHALNRDILQISIEQMFFFYNHKGKAICRIHFRSRENDAAHTVFSTHINLPCLRKQHSRMYNVPVAMCRRIKFQL